MNDIARTGTGQGAQTRVVVALARALGTAPSVASTELPAEAVDALLRRGARGLGVRETYAADVHLQWTSLGRRALLAIIIARVELALLGQFTLGWPASHWFSGRLR